MTANNVNLPAELSTPKDVDDAGAFFSMRNLRAINHTARAGEDPTQGAYLALSLALAAARQEDGHLTMKRKLLALLHQRVGSPVSAAELVAASGSLAYSSHVRRLRADGWRIEYRPNQGYVLRTTRRRKAA